MEIIDRYIYAVTKYLPSNTRADVAKELRSNIEDMLPDGYSLDDAKKALTSLGDPSKLASEYSGKRHFLIGPDYFDKYLHVLITLVPIIGFVSLVVSAVNNSSWNGTIIDILTNGLIPALSGAFTSIINTSFFVTLFFVIVERMHHIHEWSVDSLPTIPDTEMKRISIAEPILAISFSTVVAYIICFKSQIIAIYTSVAPETMQRLPFLNEARITHYTPVIIILTVLIIAIGIWQIITRKWTLPLAAANCASGVMNTAFIIWFLSDSSIYNHFNNTQFLSLMDKRSVIVAVIIVVAMIGLIKSSLAGFKSASR